MDPRCCLAAHFTVQSLNINKGQLEPGEMSDMFLTWTLDSAYYFCQCPKGEIITFRSVGCFSVSTLFGQAPMESML